MVINKCPHCGKENESGKPFKVHGTYLWVNQHGGVRRHFCKFCGAISDTRFFKNGEYDYTLRIKIDNSLLIDKNK